MTVLDVAETRLAQAYKQAFASRYAYVFLLAPALSIIALVTIYPLVHSFYISLQLNRLGFVTRFVGFQNYMILLQDPEFWHALGNTVFLITVGLALQLALGLAIALLIRKPFRFQNIVRTIIIMPYFLAPVVVGFQFKWMFSEQFGVINAFLIDLDLAHLAQPWITEKWTALLVIMLANTWKDVSFMALVMMAGLESIPRTPYEAATMAGANPLRQFKDITLPLLARYIIIALLIRVVATFGILFDFVSLITAGGPGEATEVIPTRVYRYGFEFFDFGRAAAWAYTGVLFMMVAFLGLFLGRRRIA